MDKFYITVTNHNQAIRLDLLLSQNYPDHSRNKWQQAINNGLVKVNNKASKSNTMLKIGDVVCAEIITEQQTDYEPQDIDFNVIYEDSDIIVVNKQAGLVVHPAAGNPDQTLLNGLLYRFPRTKFLPRGGIVHRLDKDTSGLMVVAHSEIAYNHLVNQIKERQMERIYQALVYRYVTAGGTIDAPIGRHPIDRLKQAIRPNGKPARTHYKINQRFQGFTLLTVKLETGRTHQIRVHMAYRKHPIVGDKIYCPSPIFPKKINDLTKTKITQFQRQALHAQSLQLKHPTTHKTLNFHSDLPKDIADLLAILPKDSQNMAGLS